MLKLGIIGLGDIARKAYLPVIGAVRAEVHLFTRDKVTLAKVAEQYRFANIHHSLESLIKTGITGAFVHTSTASHEKIIEELLENGIHVYVDKPITYDYASSEKLVALAKKKSLLFTVGFNRRYAPAYQHLKELKPNMILMQKNRKALPADVRTFIFDDFIHVVDTLLYLFPYPVEKLIVTGKKERGLLYHTVIQLLSADGATAVGIMNRDSGTVEEKLEVFTPTEKRVVHDLSEVVIHRDKNQLLQGTDDWSGTLHTRGFEQIIEEFLHALASPAPHRHQQEMLRSHQMCEQIVEKLSEG